MGAFTLAFWYKEQAGPETGTETSAGAQGLMPHLQWERESPLDPNSVRPIAVLVFHNHFQRAALHGFFLAEFTTRMIALVALCAVIPPGFYFLFVALAVMAALGVLAASRVACRGTSLEELGESMRAKRVRWGLHVMVQLFVTVQTEETPPSQVYALHGYRAVETFAVAVAAYASSGGAGHPDTLFALYWAFLVLAEASLSFLALASQGRTTTIGEDAAVSCKVYSHGLGEVYVGFLDQMQKEGEVTHRPSATQQLAHSLQLDQPK